MSATKKAPSEAPLEEKTIGSEVKKMAPPNAITCVLVDHMNARALEKRFEEVKATKDEAQYVEKLAHTMLEALMPVVKDLKKGGTLAQSMSQKVIEIEKMLGKIQGTKKHLDNAEFTGLMEAKKAACEEQFEEEEQALAMMMEELGEEELAQAATLMESVKIKASLAPQKEVYA